MVIARKINPFFFSVNGDIAYINEFPDKAKDELIARNHVLYKKTLFRAFLHYSKEEVDTMTIQDYIDSTIMLKEVLNLTHAPFMDHEK